MPATFCIHFDSLDLNDMAKHACIGEIIRCAERFLQPDAELAHKLPLDSSWYEGIDLGDFLFSV